jgi:AcrR family transcriptional regulator
MSALKRQQPSDPEAPVRTARGRHAPPPEVRLPLQRLRLLRAAAAEFAERGYAAVSAASIARRARMSKATYYAHFANKEACMVALFDRASEVVADAIAGAASSAGTTDEGARLRAATRAFLAVVSEHPEFAQTLLVEIIGAGPAVAGRRDEVVQTFADILDAENAAAARHGLSPRFASPYDAYAVVGGIIELLSRQLRLGDPEDVLELAPVIDRLIEGALPRGASG